MPIGKHLTTEDKVRLRKRVLSLRESRIPYREIAARLELSIQTVRRLAGAASREGKP